jgi:hypothetical protein
MQRRPRWITRAKTGGCAVCQRIIAAKERVSEGTDSNQSCSKDRSEEDDG